MNPYPKGMEIWYIFSIMLDLRKKSSRSCWLVGHRGALGLAPENTMIAFKTGLSLGADLVECDVHLSKDRKCIVMHDESLERTTNGTGLIRDTLWNRIKKLDAGSWNLKKFKGEKVPTLKELLLWAKKQKTNLGLPLCVVIEIKNEPVRYFEIEKIVIETVLETGMQERVILISFDHGVIKRAKNLNSKISAGILYNHPLKNPFEKARHVHADALFPRRHLVTRSLVQQAHQKGLAVATWTVNEIPEMKKMIGTGIDAIATNFPNLLNRLLN